MLRAGGGLCPKPNAAGQGVTGSPRALLQPGLRSRRRPPTEPRRRRGAVTATAGLHRLNLPTSRSQPTGPGARAPADWLTRRASSFATSAQGRGGEGPDSDHAPPRLRPAPGVGTRTTARSQGPPKADDPGARETREPYWGKARTRYHWPAQKGLGFTDNLWGPWETLLLRSSVSQPGAPPPGQ